MPLSIGRHVLSGKAFLAPMSGVTDVAMRRVAEGFGASLTVSEMVASADYAGKSAESLVRAQATGTGLHVVQLAGCDPHWMGEAARLAEGSGADIIDINMGCPAKRVTGGQSGSALMREPDLALRLIEATVAAVKIPVTLKMRLGWDDTSHNAPELALRAEQAGIQLVTVHGRTRCQFYKGSADWRAVARVKKVVQIPVVVNGDCHSSADAVVMLDQSGADGVMIGRAAIGQPWLVGDIAHYLSNNCSRPACDVDMRRAAILEHYESLLSILGIHSGLRHARKHLAAAVRQAMHDGYDMDASLLERIVTSENADDVKAMISQIYSGPFHAVPKNYTPENYILENFTPTSSVPLSLEAA